MEAVFGTHLGVIHVKREGATTAAGHGLRLAGLCLSKPRTPVDANLQVELRIEIIRSVVPRERLGTI